MQLKILVVDDEVHITKLIENFLLLEGYDVETSNSPLEVLSKIQSQKYHIVITDIMMPEMSGVDLIREIKKYDGMIQIIAITGYITVENTLTAFRLGASNIFFKPFERLEDLLEEIQAINKKLDRVLEVLKSRPSKDADAD